MKLTRRQIKGLEALTHASDHTANGIYTMPENGGFLAISGCSFALMPGDIPKGSLELRGEITDQLRGIIANYLSPVGDIVVTMPTREELQAYIEINKNRIVGSHRRFTAKMRERVKPYPLNNGDFLAYPFRLLEMLDILPGATVTTSGKERPLYFQDGDALGVVMPYKKIDAQHIEDLLLMADDARIAASQPKPKKEKLDNQGQPINFRQLKKAILGGSIIEFTNKSGEIVTGNSLFNGRPTIIDISAPGSSKYWVFKDGYCLHYWDNSEIFRGDDDITFKIRILGPMPEQTEDEKAQEAEIAKKRDEAREAKRAAEAKARREEEERKRTELLEADAKKIEAAKKALANGGIIENCTVCTMQDGQEREENIFAHLGRIYGVKLPPRTKSVIVDRLRHILVVSEGVCYSANLKKGQKLANGAIHFLLGLKHAAEEDLYQRPTDGAERENNAEAIQDTAYTENEPPTAPDKPETRYTEHLQNAIGRWYENAYKDHGVSGRFINTWKELDSLIIHWQEDTIAKDGGTDTKIYETRIEYYRDYTPEQVYNIWMEQGDMNARVIAERHQAPEDAKAEQSEASPAAGNDGAKQLKRTSKPVMLHALKTALRHYEKFAYITPENAVHIREQIDRLKDEIKRLQDELVTAINTS